MTYTPGPVGRPAARWRCCRARRGGARASAMTSSALSAPRSCARPISATSTSAVGERVRQGAVARPDEHVEALGQAREVEAREAPGQQATGERDGVEHAHADARAVEAHERAIEHADVERRVVRDEDAAARKREQLRDGRAQRARPGEVAIADARELG